MQKRLLEIEARKAELRKEIDTATSERLAEIQTETNTLITEENQIRSKIDLTGKLGNPEVKPEGRSNEKEERAKKFVETRRTEVEAKEVRSLLLSTGGLATPTGTDTNLTEPFNTVSSIVDQLYVHDGTGMGTHKIPYVKAWQTASAKTDGTAQTASDPAFGTITITPFLLAVTTYVSRELSKQTPIQYEASVRKGALIALKKKLSNWIVTGGGSTELYGIYNAVDTAAANMYTTISKNTAIDEKTLRKLVMAYGGNEQIGANARLYLHKNDLIAFGDVRGTNEKKAIYDIIPDGSNPNTGLLKDGGLSVPYTICSDVTSYTDATGTAGGVKTMVYGDPSNYELCLFGNYEVRVSEDYKFAEGLNTVMGEVMVGGNIIVQNGFVVLLKTT